MPPKLSKKSASKAKVGRAVNPIEDLKSLQNMDEVLTKAQQLRNYFQVERDKVNEMWAITKKELSNEEARLSNTESELVELERNHQIEMKVYKQKVRHLLYGQKLSVKQLKEESDAALQQAEVLHEKIMTEIYSKKQLHSKEMQTALETNADYIMEQHDTHQYMVSVTKKQNHEKELARLQSSYEAKLVSLREDLELRRRAEVNDIEERWNEHINHLIHQHDEKFAEMKSYYNNITKNKLVIIQALKDEIVNMKKNDVNNETLIYDIEKENQNLIAPLEQAEREVTELELKKKQHFQDKQSLSMTRARYKNLCDELKRLCEQHHQLEIDYKKVYDEREDLKVKFESSLREAMNVLDEGNAGLQQWLLEANAKIEERDAQLEGILKALHLEPSVMRAVSDEIDLDLSHKNQTIKDLYFELKKMESKTNELLTIYECRAQTLGIPLLDLRKLAQA
ncbi:unnamed protein product [Phytomonas sp. Hart1]|nr:unnamed protein product [Phytomonas sp. Hart1]|eukprot:CCW66974.1 unnamed protein product [Phytomonas sp. isolate Hart1]